MDLSLLCVIGKTEKETNQFFRVAMQFFQVEL
jgi:hypothetical protein